MIDTDGKFYLGRVHDLDKGKTTDKNVFYDPDDLTTHAVVVGMTGSGKTGLCIDLLEEAALQNLPALMIDPKGDITNALLHFPDLLPTDFEPWVNPDDARKDGKTTAEAAEGAAGLWKKGLGDWGIEKDRIQALSNAAEFTIYTPGSDAGIPISILASLKAPGIEWEENKELLREKIAGTATALLGLVGMEDVDPVRSREHILLANIFEGAWSENKDLDLAELIVQVQNPPFEKLGVLDLNTFFPEKERFELAMLLNNILASPAFQAWIEGQPLDVETLLYAEDGRPKHSVFYIAHLSDSERMFFVTLLYSAIATWMRAQSGTDSLRAIVYFDEIYGYLPPTAEPPSKPLMLRMLKQARAFGVGQVLVTQNPVDLDYKALSNTGTWFIGRLQTERDKDRLLDGLEGVSGDMDRKAFDSLISKLDKRVFLLHNVHEKAPQVFYTRWAMNYLTGPLTRAQIPALNKLAGAKASTPKSTKKKQPTATRKKKAAKKTEGEGSSTRPAVPTGVEEYFLPVNLTLSKAAGAAGEDLESGVKRQGMLYRPALVAQADVRYLQRKYKLDHEAKRSAVVDVLDRRGTVRWEEFLANPLDPADFDRAPDADARFATIEAPLSEAKTVKSLERDFVDWAYRESEVTVFGNATLKQYAGPPVTEAEFRKQLSAEAREARDAEIKKLKGKYKTKINSVQKKLTREKRELAEDQEDLNQRKMVEMGTHLENVIGLFGKSRSSRRLSSSLTKRRMTAQAKADVEESLDAIEELEADLAELADEIEDEIDEIEEKWGEIANEIEEIPVTPYKKDVLVELFGLAWLPHYIVEVNGETMELPAFSAG
ncbi:MAG: ATP-binding protein [Chloroflexi bacterium]|nr:MAG: ATP-binding protein [Chloroflexota bacterium]MBL1196589.1 ATP-binding protein [Chloroflexota bacterium]NOH13884.1 ATP-binding protein [Chloroflexota bacterium]